MSDVSTIWQEMVTQALVGLERVNAPEPTCEGSLGEALRQAREASPERGFLARAAIVAQYHHAGRMPSALPEMGTDPCDIDDLPCPALSSHHCLSLMLLGQHADLLPEWLCAVASRGMRAPEESLPQLLDLAKSDPALCELVSKTLGKRGKWLAAQNPEWRCLYQDDSDAVWEIGTRRDRLAFLRHMRATDPDQARELLLSTWSEETAEERAAFVTVLEVGLSMADEPFLESALDDRRKEVRRAAASLLARLPESRLCRRMLERVRPLLTFTPGQKLRLFLKGHRPELSVELPAEHTKEMDRDGIEPNPAHGAGKKAWWLAQMLGTIPPRYWTTIWETTPQEIISIIRKTEWEWALLEGFGVAAQRYQDSEWLGSLFLGAIAHYGSWGRDKSVLIAAMPPDKREEFVLKECSYDYLAYALMGCEHPWSQELSQHVLRRLRHSASGDISEQASKWGNHFSHLACFIAPSIYPEAAATLSPRADCSDDFRRQLSKFMEILKFRYEMLESFQDPSRKQ